MLIHLNQNHSNLIIFVLKDFIFILIIQINFEKYMKE